MSTTDYTGVDVLEILEDAHNYNDFLAELVRRQAVGRKRLLDFGAGIGTFARSLRGAGYDVTCVEPDTGMAARLAGAGFAVEASVPAAGGFDLIYTLNVLEHIEDDVGILRTFKGALAPGGKVYIYVPAFPSLYSAFDKKVGHVRRYRKAELVGKLKAAGFAVESARYVDSLGYLAALVFRVVSDDKGSVSPGAVRVYDRLIFPLSRLLDRVLSPFFGKNLAVIAS